MHQIIACVTGGLVPFGGNATTAHIISADLSQIYVAASWVGTVELAIVAVVGLCLWFWGRKVAKRV